MSLEINDGIATLVILLSWAHGPGPGPMGPGPIGPGKKFRGLRVLLKQHSGYKIDMAISYIP